MRIQKDEERTNANTRRLNFWCGKVFEGDQVTFLIHFENVILVRLNTSHPGCGIRTESDHSNNLKRTKNSIRHVTNNFEEKNA